MRYLKYYGINLNPDLILLTFFTDDYISNNIDMRVVDGFLHYDPILIFGHVSFLLEFIDKRISRYKISRFLLNKDYSESELLIITKELLEDLQCFCKRKGVYLIILHFPRRKYTKFCLPSDKHRAPEKYISLKEVGINAIEMVEVINKLKDSPYLSDDHPNPKGHQLIAKLYFDTIKKRNLLK